jgi:hypothetical protein
MQQSLKQCDRCKLIVYCSTTCQQKHWHAGHNGCKPVPTPPTETVERLQWALDATRYTAIVSMGSDRGIVATQHIRQGRVVAMINLRDNYHTIEMKDATLEELKYGHVMQLDATKIRVPDVLPVITTDPTNGCLANDNVDITELHAALCTNTLSQFLEKTELTPQTASFQWIDEEGMLGVIVTTSNVARGTPITIRYGYEYWLRLYVMGGIQTGIYDGTSAYQAQYTAIHGCTKLQTTNKNIKPMRDALAATDVLCFNIALSKAIGGGMCFTTSMEAAPMEQRGKASHIATLQIDKYFSINWQPAGQCLPSLQINDPDAIDPAELTRNRRYISTLVAMCNRMRVIVPIISKGDNILEKLATELELTWHLICKTVAGDETTQKFNTDATNILNSAKQTNTCTKCTYALHMPAAINCVDHQLQIHFQIVPTQ